MEKTLTRPLLGGKIKAISSKSMAHRLLICAAFAEGESEILCENVNADISATVSCLNALGAKIVREGDLYIVTPISEVRKNSDLDCGESGSTLRFLLPVAAAIGADSRFVMHGRLSQRPLSPLYEELEGGGISLSAQGSNPLTISGALNCGEYKIAANVSSQFVSGLMFALPLIGRFSSKEVGESSLILTGAIESAPYIDMTLDALKIFGVSPYEAHPNEGEAAKYIIPSGARLCAPTRLFVEGDWSNAAFWLSAGAIGKSPVTVTSLNTCSHQGDKEILSLLRRFGAEITEKDNEITVSRGNLRGIKIDASQIPDLVPILAVVASVSEGQTVIVGASRLRIKESDRLLTVCDMLTRLGADIKETEDGLIINGKPTLEGGQVHAHNDHRIAMAAAIASVVCENRVTIENAEAVSKSYPDFWRDFEALCQGDK